MQNEFEIDYDPDFNLLIFGASGGRIDHTFNIYNLSCKYSEKFKDLIKAKFYLFGESSLSIILNAKADNIIKCSNWEYKEGGYSLFPLSGIAETKITDLDENNQETDITCKYINIINSIFNIFLHKDFKISCNNYLFSKKNLPNSVMITFTKLHCDSDNAFLFNLTLKDHNSKNNEV